MIQLFKPKLTSDAILSVLNVLQSGWIGLGPKVEEFEKKFAKFVGANYAVATNNCTSALHLALIISGVTEGDEVITTPLTFVSTNHVILYQKAIPVFADVDPRTCCIDPDSIERLITPKTKAIICVHFGGMPCDLNRIYNIAVKHNLKVIQDAAHACESVYEGDRIGFYGTSCFSFHAVKNLPIGDGGMITVHDEADYQRLKKLVWLGIDKSTYERSKGDSGRTYAWQYDCPEVGYKYHMNDIAAALGIEQLKTVEEDNNQRRGIVAMYISKLHSKDIIEYPKIYGPDHTTRSSCHLAVLQVNRRDQLIDHLKSNDIAPGVHYRLNTRYPMYQKCKADIKNALTVEDRLISLPLHLDLTYGDVDKIIDTINGGW